MKHNSANPVETFVNNEVLIKLSNKAAAMEMAIKDGSYKQPDGSDDEAEYVLQSPYREIYVTTSIESTKITFLVKRQDGVKYDFFSDLKTFIAKELQISRNDLAVEDYDITESRARESESLNAIYEPLLKTRIPLSEFNCHDAEQFNAELKRRYEASLEATRQKTSPDGSLHSQGDTESETSGSFSSTSRVTTPKSTITISKETARKALEEAKESGIKVGVQMGIEIEKERSHRAVIEKEEQDSRESVFKLFNPNQKGSRHS